MEGMKGGWHSESVEGVLSALGSGPSGLTAGEVAARLSVHGQNVLQEKARRSTLSVFLHQFTDFMIVVLMVAAVISGFMGDRADMYIILVIVFLNAVLGFVQEYRAGKAMEALKRMTVLRAQVIRDGLVEQIPSTGLVPGDLVLLEAGNAVPADMRLTEAHSLRVDESALTGESVAVDKSVAPIAVQAPPLGDRFNMAYKGTLVTGGRARGVVVATGMFTEIGLIAAMLQEDPRATPLQRRMSDFGRRLSYIVLLICGVLLVTGLLRGESLRDMVMLSISLAVAAIPEALPALITIALAIGAHRMVRRNALIRRLPAVETLGSVDYICTDKTGTLTENRMRVVDTDVAEQLPILHGLSLLDCAILLNHEVRVAEDGTLQGDATEVALVDSVLKRHGREALKRVLEAYPRVGEVPFDAERRTMTTAHRMGERHLVVAKGAVDSLFPLGDGWLSRVADRADAMASEGKRVIAYAYRFMDRPLEDGFGSSEHGWAYAGMCGMIDPPRADVSRAVGDCHAAGIDVVMITGDHPATAAAIARDIGILRRGDLLLTGAELAALDPAAFSGMVEQVRVYARVSPSQKLDIVKALRGKGNFIAMTGDGVNDAPALQAADIGIAMGVTGTDVSKEAAQMVLLDDDFSTIVNAVREGRRIYDNIRKFVKYFMTCNAAEIWTITFAPILGMPIPLLPIHLLWINLVTDGLPGLALAGERAEKDVMRRPPRPYGESLFAGGSGIHIVWVSLLMAGVTLAAQALSMGLPERQRHTVVFTILALSQLGHVLAIRSERRSLFRQGLHSNLPLLAAVLSTVLLQLLVVQLPFANDLFRTMPLSLSQWVACFGAAAIVFHAVEVEKLVRRFSDRRRASRAIPFK